MVVYSTRIKKNSLPLPLITRARTFEFRKFDTHLPNVRYNCVFHFVQFPLCLRVFVCFSVKTVRVIHFFIFFFFFCAITITIRSACVFFSVRCNYILHSDHSLTYSLIQFKLTLRFFLSVFLRCCFVGFCNTNLVNIHCLLFSTNGNRASKMDQGTPLISHAIDSLYWLLSRFWSG